MTPWKSGRIDAGIARGRKASFDAVRYLERAGLIWWFGFNPAA
jgi:hypothetical protein